MTDPRELSETGTTLSLNKQVPKQARKNRIQEHLTKQCTVKTDGQEVQQDVYDEKLHHYSKYEWFGKDHTTNLSSNCGAKKKVQRSENKDP